MNQIDLINLIREHLKKTNNQRDDNYINYSLKELIKVCGIYNIQLNYNAY
jgi:hypothetical protein